MEERFIVQMRPTASGDGEEFYFRIVDTHTGETSLRSYREQGRADEQCKHLNRLADEASTSSSEFGSFIAPAKERST